MVKKFIKIIIYFLIVVLVTFILMLYVEARIVVGFLEDNREKALENDYNLINATMIANNRNSKCVSIDFEPLLHYETVSYQSFKEYDIKFYSIVEHKEDIIENAFIIIVKNSKINDTEEDSKIKARITLSSPDLLSFTVFDEDFVVGYDDSLNIMLIREYDVVGVFENGVISKIELYELVNNQEITILTAINDITNDLYDLNYDETTKTISYDISQNISERDLETNLYYHDSYWSENYDEYQIQYLYFAIGEIIVFSVITLYLFFPKLIKRIIKKIKTVKGFKTRRI